MASLHSPSRDQINLAAQQFGQFQLHLDMIEQAPLRLWLERNEDVDVTFRPEIVAQYRAEQRQFGYSLTPTEIVELIFGHKCQCHEAIIVDSCWNSITDRSNQVPSATLGF